MNELTSESIQKDQIKLANIRYWTWKEDCLLLNNILFQLPHTENCWHWSMLIALETYWGIRCMSDFVLKQSFYQQIIFLFLPIQSIVKAFESAQPYIQEPLNASQCLFLHFVLHSIPHLFEEYLSSLQPDKKLKRTLCL